MTETRKQDAVTESVKELHRCLEQAEAVVIGAGSGGLHIFRKAF